METTSIIELRNKHAQVLIDSLPFPVANWPSVVADRCHRNHVSLNGESGLGLADFQVQKMKCSAINTSFHRYSLLSSIDMV